MKTSQLFLSNNQQKPLVSNRSQWKKMTAGAALVASLLFISHTSLAASISVSESFQSLKPGQKEQSVQFQNGIITMAGNLYFPNGFDPGKKYKAIIVTHPGGGVKEQTADLYAQKLSGEGYVTLAFDASHQGASGGEPRFLENPAERVEDIRSGVDFLTTLPFVDEAKIGALGICAGGGYTINAAMAEHRIKAVGTVSAVDIGEVTRKGWAGDAKPSDLQQLLDTVAKQRTVEARGGEVKFVPYIPQVGDTSVPKDLQEAADYYLTDRAQHPNAQNKMRMTSLDKIAAFSAFDQMGDLFHQPLLMIAGSDAGSLWQSRLAYDLAKSKKELFIVPGATHMTLYDKPTDVNQAVEKLTAFYGKNL